MVQTTNQNDVDTIALNDDWTFYPQQLLAPHQLVHSIQTPLAIAVPSSWRQHHNAKVPLDNFSYGTYSYKFNIPKEDIGTEKALAFYYIGSAYRIWINGKEYRGLGVVATTKEEETAKLQKHYIPFEPTDETIEIVMQVSNFSFREGGIINEILYGDEHDITQSHLKATILTALLIGGYFIFGAYHLLIYYLRKPDQALFYIGLFSIVFSFRTLFVTEHVMFLFFPSLPWEELIKIEYVLDVILVLSVPLLYKRLFPEETNEGIVRICKIIAFVFLAIIILTPSEIFTRLVPYHTLIFYVFILYLTFDVSIRAKAHNKKDATVNLFSLCIPLIAFLHDTLIYISVLHSFYLGDYGFLMFIFLQAILISNRYWRAYTQNKQLTKELETTNATLEIKVHERTKELIEKNKELHSLQQTRTHLLSNVAHDIGSPIVGVQTYLKIMKEGKIPIDNQQVISQIMDRLSYIQKLNNDLLVLSKLEAQQLPFNFEVMSAYHFFEEFYHSLFFEQQRDALTINKGIVDVEPHLLIYIDKQRIRQALQNYLDNAIKFNETTTNIITLHCYVQQVGNEQKIIFEVEDYGAGISPDVLPYIFERFFKQRKANTSGSGLGLGIVKEIIEQHQGMVGVRSKEEGGSTFYFSLPMWLEGQSPPDDFSHLIYRK